MTPPSRPWPTRKTGIRHPLYRVLICNTAPDVGPLLITESALCLLSSEEEATRLEFPNTLVQNRRLEVGLAQSDLPKRLESSWKEAWISFQKATFEYSELLRSDDDRCKSSAVWWTEWLDSDQPEALPKNSDISVCVLASFVDHTDAKPAWVPITMGKIRSSRKAHGDWLDFHIERQDAPDASGSHKRVAEPKDLKLTLVMSVTLLVWIFKYFSSMPGQGNTAADSFFNVLHGTPEWIYHLAISVFLIVHHVRMAIGVEFAARDTTFFRAKLHASEARRECRAWIESLSLASIVALSVLLTYSVSFSEYAFTALVMLLQGVIIIWYDIVFKDALLEYDQDRRLNRLLVFGDMLFVLVTAIMLVSRLNDSFYGQASYIGIHTSAILFLLCGAYSVVFGFEVSRSYKFAMRAFASEFRTALTEAFSNKWRVGPGEARLCIPTVMVPPSGDSLE